MKNWVRPFHLAELSWSDEWWATIGNLPVCIIVLYHASPQITNCLGTSKDMERHVGPKRDKNHQESWAGGFVRFDSPCVGKLGFWIEFQRLDQITMEYYPKNTLAQWLDPANLYKTSFPFGYPFPFFPIFSTLKILIIILLVPDINKTGGIFATKNTTPDQWPPHRTNLFVYPFPSFSIFSIPFHTFHLSSKGKNC